MKQSLSLEERIACHLILHSSSLTNLGLFHGKIGVVMTMYRLAHGIGNSMYEDYAGILFDEIFEDITTAYPFDLENGLCGIGWGILWLLRHGYIGGDPEEIMADIDKKIVEYDLRRMSDRGLRHGCGGILFYMQARMSMSALNVSPVFDEPYISEVKSFLTVSTIPSEKEFLRSISMERFDATNFLEMPLGLENGCAGYLFNKNGDAGETA